MLPLKFQAPGVVALAAAPPRVAPAGGIPLAATPRTPTPALSISRRINLRRDLAPRRQSRGAAGWAPEGGGAPSVGGSRRIPSLGGDGRLSGIGFVINLIPLLLLSVPLAAAFSAPPAGFQAPNPQVETRPTDIRFLKLGEPVERELKGGESHSYRARLEAGQYLKVVVEQRGIDVVVRLSGPDGKQIAEVDSPNGARGPEPVDAIAEAAGEYRLEVKALDEKAETGRYEIKVEALREPTAEDRERMAAASALARALAEARQLRAQGTAESLRNAIIKYNEALPLLRTVGNRHGEANTLMSLGVVYWQLGDSRKALEYENQALPIWRELGNIRQEGTVLHNIGVNYWQLGDSRKALEYYSQALPLLRAAGDRKREADALNATGLAHGHLGNLREALEYHNQALAVQHAAGERKNDAAYTLNNIGMAYYRLGHLQKALEHFAQALPLRRAAGDRRGEAAALSNTGLVYWALAENQKAIEYFNQALPLVRVTGDRNSEFSALNNIGLVHQAWGETPKALDYYSQALSVVRAVGDQWGEAATLHNIGTAYRSLGEPQKALNSLNQALLVRRTVGDRWGESITLSQIGTIYSSLGKPEEALSYFAQALSLHRAVGDRSSEANTLRDVARAERNRGHLDAARTQVETALNIIEGARSQFVSQELRTSFSASRLEFYELYVDLLMRMHRSQPSAGYAAAALQASERARSRSLLETLTEARADIRRGADPALLERERSSRQRLSAKSEGLTRLLGGRHTQEQAAAVRQEVEALLEEYRRVQAQIRAESPRYAALTQPQPLLTKEIQQLLDDETLLLEYALGEERSFLWAVTATSIKSFELPGRAEIEAAVRRVYDLFTARNKIVKFEEASERRARVAKADAEYPRAAGALSRALLEPVTDQMKGKRLLIVSDGVLQYLPFAALPLPDSSTQRSQHLSYVPLIARHEVISLPSASTLAVLRKELAGRKPAPKIVAVLADPVFDSDDERVKGAKSDTKTRQASDGDKTQGEVAVIESKLTRSMRDLASDDDESSFPPPRLPFTRQEADSVVAFATARRYEKATDFAANRAAAIDPGLSQYRYVHFATHALLNTRHPELSGIVLSLVDHDGKEQDGFLLAHEVYNLNLPAELIVLSGCRTGLGKEIKGEGLMSLTRGFMYAGAERVVVSLWDVNDKSTAELMAQFYKGMLGKQRLTPSAALRRAQVAMWKSARWHQPYYWAAFVLYGEYR